MKEQGCRYSNRKFYEKEALYVERYRSPNFWESRYHRKRMEVVTEILKTHLGKNTFFDVGCGAGEYLTLACSFHCEVIGADISANYLRRAKAWCRKVALVQADIRALPFRDDCADVTLCSEVVEHLPNINPALKEIFRVTRQVVVVTTPNYGFFRRAIARVSKSYLEEVNRRTGHLTIIPIDQLCKELNRYKWRVKLARTLYVIYPPISALLRLPRLLEPIVAALEASLGILSPILGNISVVVVARTLS